VYCKSYLSDFQITTVVLPIGLICSNNNKILIIKYEFNYNKKKIIIFKIVVIINNNQDDKCS